MTTPEDTTIPTYPDVHVELTGQDGNVFSVIGRTSGAIRKAHGSEAANAFIAAAGAAQSYDEVLRLVMRTVETS